ncbi:MAG: hypothetical protein GMKNLPBB_01804 [Myxococcota bacterium]|nr:hypothetical protein [Myxococcota bacterium]
MMKRHLLILILAAALTVPFAAHAQYQQTLGQGVIDYKDGKYTQAAARFFDVANNSNNPTEVQAAEFYLGRALVRLTFYQPALQYMGKIIRTGPAHPHFLEAVEELVTIKEKLNDDTLIPNLITQSYSSDKFSALANGTEAQKKLLYKLNYIVGAYQYRRSQFQPAELFLNAVAADSEVYPEAQYYLGLVKFKQNRDQDAITHFNEVDKYTSQRLNDKRMQRVRRLAYMAMARTHYGAGRYMEASDYYGKIPRFTEDWFDALFERGWAHYKQQDFGKTLGTLHSLHSPHFDDVYQPETFILEAITYYQNCLYGAALEALETFKARYEPQIAQIQTVIANTPDPLKLYEIIVISDKPGGPFPLEPRNYMFKNPRFQRFHGLVTELRREKDLLEKTEAWNNSPLQGRMRQLITNDEQQILKVAGAFAKTRLLYLADVIQGFKAQALVIEFEIKKGQAECLASGKCPVQSIQAKDDKAADSQTPAAPAKEYPKLPKPKVPGTNHDYWAFNDEWWLDELGYYEFSVRDMCKQN